MPYSYYLYNYLYITLISRIELKCKDFYFRKLIESHYNSIFYQSLKRHRFNLSHYRKQ